MAQKIQTKQEEQEIQKIGSFETFIKKYQKILSTVVLAALVIVFGALALNKWVVTPQKEEAKGQMFYAEAQFRSGLFEQALNGDGNYLGFAQIIDEYGSKAGKAVYLYAGICQLNLGNNDEAISYLKKYSTSDKILKGRALCCIGDAYANKGDNAQALSYFKKAAAVEDNAYRAGYLKKAGIICEEMGNNDEAVKLYEEVQTKYPQSLEGYDINKYISRIKNSK